MELLKNREVISRQAISPIVLAAAFFLFSFVPPSAAAQEKVIVGHSARLALSIGPLLYGIDRGLRVELSRTNGPALSPLPRKSMATRRNLMEEAYKHLIDPPAQDGFVDDRALQGLSMKPGAP